MTIIASINGRVARDGELRQSKAGKPWCRVSVACYAGKDREKDEELTQWFTLIAFGRVAEDLAGVEKGQTVSAIGRVELNRWTTQEGETREDMRLICDAIVTARSAGSGGRKSNDNGDRGGHQATHRAQAPAQADAPFDDDIPF